MWQTGAVGNTMSYVHGGIGHDEEGASYDMADGGSGEDQEDQYGEEEEEEDDEDQGGEHEHEHEDGDGDAAGGDGETASGSYSSASGISKAVRALVWRCHCRWLWLDWRCRVAWSRRRTADGSAP
jgi:hypothetical protein